MKLTHIFPTFLLVTTLLSFACNSSKDIKFTVTNIENIDINDASLTIPVSSINELWESKKGNQTIAIKNSSNEFIPFQIDTISANQVEIAFSLDLKSKEQKKISIELVEKSELPKFQNYTNVRLGKDTDFDGNFDDMKEEMRDSGHIAQSEPPLYQMEGIAWENDKVGFRSYWDSRNGKDIFGKLIETPVLDTVGLANTKSYHELSNWGMDILKVGNSLGAGAIAIYKNDSIYRLGETKAAYFKLITEGPIRAIFDMEYKAWIVDNKEYTLRERVTIWKGKYYYHSKLFLSGDLENIKLLTGITNLHSDTSYTLANKNFKILYTHGKQSENQDTLGMAIIINENNFIDFGVTANKNKGVSNTYYAEMKVSENINPEFYFVAGWEKTNNNFSSKLGFEKYLKKATEEINNLVSIKK